VFDAYDSGRGGVDHVVSPNVRIEVGESRFFLSEVRSVWWRLKPRGGVSPNSPTGLYDSTFVFREWNYLLNYIGEKLQHVFCINDRRMATVADNKVIQLEIARECGFSCPETLISNDVNSVMKFIQEQGDAAVVFKTFTPYMPPNGKITFTTVVDQKTIEEHSGLIRHAPGMFQRFIAKRFELRVTVVGNECFAARIDSNRSPESSVDWRSDQFKDLFSRHELEDQVVTKIMRMQRTLGLHFAAYDFIVTPGGELVFLEVNPAGQWLWLETQLGLPVSDRIAAALTRAQR
jgi:glutathione synthase/RimK-type ligase-like ATP-grasp enzyme